MNLRDLINRIEAIELNEGLRLKDIEAQVGQEKDEQKRAQTLMTLAQTNKLPGLYDPVSGYFVSAEPDTQGEWQGAGTPTKPRISATGTEDQDALLAKRGLVPAKANTSTFLRHLNPFSSSNKDYDAGIQGGSQAAIARQNKEDAELKQLTDLIPKYKELKAKLSALTGEGSSADTGHEVVPTGKYLSEALMESFSDLFEYDRDRIVNQFATNSGGAATGGAHAGQKTIENTPVKDITMDTAILTLPARMGGDTVYDVNDLVLDLGLTALFAVGGTLLAPVTGGGSEAAAAAAAAPRIVRIGRALARRYEKVGKNFSSIEEFKNAISNAAKNQAGQLHKELKYTMLGTAAINAGGVADAKAGTGVYDYVADKTAPYIDPIASTIGSAYRGTKHAFGLDESVASLKAKIAAVEGLGSSIIKRGGEDAVERGAKTGTEVALHHPDYPIPNWVYYDPNKSALTIPGTGRNLVPYFDPKMNPVMKDITPEILQLVNHATPAEQKALVSSPSRFNAVIDWLKANPKKSIAGAVAATALMANQIGGGRGTVNPPPALPGGEPGGENPAAGTKTTPEPTTYQIKPGDTLSRIAQQNGVSVAELMAVNPSITNPNRITAGATITIPSASGRPVYDQGVGSTPMPGSASTTLPYDAPNPTKTDSDADAEAEAKKKAEIEATQKEIDTTKQQLAALIVDLEKSEDEDNIKQLQGLEAQLDDLDDIKALNANNPSASNYTNQMDQASDAASAKTAQADNPSSANYTNQMDRASDAATAKAPATPKKSEAEKSDDGQNWVIPNEKNSGGAIDTSGKPVQGKTGSQSGPTDYSVASAPNAKGAKMNANESYKEELNRWLKIANIK
jgi:murein DD-endopeptidase MepM/ murein hydrolase activator NlpD